MGNGSQHPSVHEKISMLSRNHGIGFSISYTNAAILKTPRSITCQSSTGQLYFSLRDRSVTGSNSHGLPTLSLEAVALAQVAPFIRVKLLLQNQNEMLKSGRLSKPYKGIADCFARTIRNEGFLSLWRGHTAFTIRYFVTPVPALVFTDYLRVVRCNKGKDCYWKWFARNLAAQCAIGVSYHLLTYLLDYAHTRLATDIKASTRGITCSSVGPFYSLDYVKNNNTMSSERQFNGLVDVYKKTLKSDGIAGLYRGFGISCVGGIVYAGLYIRMNDSQIKPVVFNSRSPPQGNQLAAALLYAWAILGLQLVCYPFDTVSRRMMMTSSEAVKYENSRDAFTRILKLEGVKSLFRGSTAIIFPFAAASVMSILVNHAPVFDDRK